MNRRWLLPVGLLFFVSGLTFGQDGPRQPRKAWTVLVYQAADNDLEEALIKDFNEMERVGSTSQINILVQLDRSPRYDNSNDNWTTTRRYYITRDPEETYPPDFSTHPNHAIKSQLISDLGKKNMGDETVLREFLLWGIQTYPADRYFVILSDHGAGVRPFRMRRLPTRGMMFADSFNDYLSEDETKEAFDAAVQVLGRPIDIIGLDASEMSVIDIAYQLRDACRYLIASQLSEPNDGYPYDRFLLELAQNPSLATETFLQRFVQHYMDSYRSGQPTNGAGSAVTIAVYNQSFVPAYVQKVDALAQALAGKIGQFGSQLMDLRRQTQTFSESIYRDLFHYCQLLVQNINDAPIRTVAQAVMDGHGPGQGKALLYEDHESGFDMDVSNAKGIAVYFPDPAQFDERYLTANDFARTTKWGQFLKGLGEDTSPPKVTFVFPSSGGSVPIFLPALLLKVEDEGSAGLGTSAVQEVRLDNQRLNGFTFDANTGRLLIVPTQTLSAGNHTLTVTVTDLQGNQATRTFNFSVVPPTLPRSVRTFSVPLGLTDGDSRQVLQSPDVKTARWLTDSGWAVYPTDTQASLLPTGSGVGQPPAGLGYFVRLPQDTVFAADGTPLEPDRSYAVPVGIDWNLIANPFPAPILWNALRVQVGSNELTLEQAINAGFLLSPPIAYQPKTDNPFKFGRYLALSGDDVLLRPFEAYWVKVDTQGKTVRLILPSPVSAKANSRFVPPRKTWAVQLQVLINGEAISESDLLQFGAAPSARWGQDALDIPMPPPPPGSMVRAYFLAENWRKRSPESLASDFRPEGERIAWDFVVETDNPNGQEVTLIWKGLDKVPSSVRLWLVDKLTGQGLAMRSVSAYRFRCGERQRRFRLIAQFGQSPLRFVGMRSVPLRGRQGVLIEGRLTAPATVKATVKSLTGRTVRVLMQGEPISAGRLQLLWDGRSNEGTTLPKGVYLCELIARDETGGQVRAVLTVTF